MRSIRDQGRGSASSEWAGLLRTEARCAALEGRKDELESVLAAVGLGYCRLDAISRALQGNSQFKAEFGWAPDAPVEWDALLERACGPDRARLQSAVQAALDSGADVDLVIQITWPDDSPHWIAMRGRAIHDGTLYVALILTTRNVTLERLAARRDAQEQAAALENERELRAAAEAANRRKDQFLSVFSHELRSPLNAILGWNRILGLKRPEDPEVLAITPRIEQSARAQLKMVNDLLDLGRIESGKLRIEQRPMQLAAVVASAVDLARPAASARRVTLHADLAPGAGAMRGDPDRLQQVVSNLLSNAIKFTPAGGEVVVRLSAVEGFCELSVQDSGCGIAADLLPHVFDRFRQGDSSSTRQTGGLGLGLTLVREIVLLHGGTVAASSAGAGAGARFVVCLPARQPWDRGEGQVQGRLDEGSGEGAALRGLSILVVDDEADARNVVAETLRLEGARVTLTDSAAGALAQLESLGAQFDIVVTDIGMPEEDGYSLVRRLRARPAGRQVLTVAVTGYASRGDVQAAMDAGFDLHVPKPVDLNTFIPLIRRLAKFRGVGA